MNNIQKRMKVITNKYYSAIISLFLALFILTAVSCTTDETNITNIPQGQTEAKEDNKTQIEEDTKTDNTNVNKTETNKDETNNTEDIFKGYKLIEVDGGNLSGHREGNVVVNIGFGNREYYAYTNEYGQLVKVTAKNIILQDDSTEPVKSNGRYYNGEAKVPGVESKDLDEGHVIADSLGGVSNAYNITPQNSTLNRHGDQAYMEKNIRNAGGCTDFVAIITYPNTSTQIPSHYSYTYTLKGNVINDEFDNVNPDEYNASNGLGGSSTTSTDNSSTNKSTTSTSNAATFYWTPNGKSYHTRKNCPTLSRSKKILEGSLEDSGKKDPCDMCN